MTTSHSSFRCCRLLLAATIALTGSALAQQVGKYSLPAGQHSNRALANLLEQVERQPLAAIANPDATVSLQRASTFEADGMARFLRVVLRTNGALPAASTTLTVDSFDPILEASTLRAFAGAPDGGRHLRAVTLDDAIELTGSPQQVRFAARLLQLIDGGAAAPAPQLAGDERQVTWPGGKMGAPQLVQLLAVTLDVNVLGAVPTTDVELGEPALLSQRAWLSRASTALFEAGVWLAARLPEQRLFVVGDTTERSCAGLLRCAGFVAADDLSQRTDAMPVMTVVTLQRVQATAAMQQLMPQLPKARMSCVGMLDDRRILICGPRPEAHAFVKMLQRADAR